MIIVNQIVGKYFKYAQRLDIIYVTNDYNDYDDSGNDNTSEGGYSFDNDSDDDDNDDIDNDGGNDSDDAIIYL